MRGWRRSDSASVEPSSTDRATVAVTSRRFFESLWSARMLRHWTSGSPASIMVENWRVKIAISLSLTFPPALAWAFAPAFSVIWVTRTDRRRSSPTALMRSAASISPFWSPAALRP